MTLTSAQIKLIKSLQQKKFREMHQLFVVEGVKLVDELQNSQNFEIDTIYHTQDFTCQPLFQEKSVLISNQELERISGFQTPNKVLATVKYPSNKSINEPSDLVILLDTLNDPGNLGTILRTADWFGVQQIYASENTTELYNPKVIQASMGAIFRVDVNYVDLKSQIKFLQKLGYEVLGADMSGSNLYKHTFKNKTAILMGSESHGIQVELKELLNDRITIPSFGKTESLNVGVACAIILSQVKSGH